MTDSPETEDGANEETPEPVKVDEPEQDIVEKGDGDATPSEERPLKVSVDAPREDSVEFSQPHDPNTTLVHQDEADEGSAPSNE